MKPTFCSRISYHARAVALFAAVAAIMLAPGASAQQKQYKFASGTQGGSFYTWAGLLAAVAREDNLDLSVQSANTAVSVAQLQKKTLDFGMVLPFDAREALGALPFDKSNLRTLTMIYPTGWVVIVGAKSGIETVADLRGKRVAWGQSGHIQSVANEIVFKSLGIDPADMKRSYISAGQGVSGMRDGIIDAVAYSVGFPSPQLTEAATLKGGIRLIGLSEDQIKKVISASGGVYARTVYPTSVQPELKQELVTVAMWGQLATHDAVPDAVIYQLTRILHTKHQILVGRFKGFENATPEKTIAFHSFPLHPGVVRYYREIGAMK